MIESMRHAQNLHASYNETHKNDQFLSIIIGHYGRVIIKNVK